MLARDIETQNQKNPLKFVRALKMTIWWTTDFPLFFCIQVQQFKNETTGILINMLNKMLIVG